MWFACGCHRVHSLFWVSDDEMTWCRSALGYKWERVGDQCENWPGLWSTYGPKGGSALRRLILQSKSSSEFWASWQVSSHCSSSPLKAQEPGSPKMCSRTEERHLQVEYCLDNNLQHADSRAPLTTVQLVRSIGTVGLVVAHQVGLDALATVTNKVRVRGTTSWIREVWKKHTKSTNGYKNIPALMTQKQDSSFQFSAFETERCINLKRSAADITAFHNKGIVSMRGNVST